MAMLGHVGANPAKMKMFHPAQKASEMKLSMEERENGKLMLLRDVR